MNQFYAPPDQFAGNLVILGEDEARHIIKVLRYKEGDELIITDGVGNRYQTVIEKLTKRNLHCKILSTEKGSPQPKRVLVLGYIRQRQRLEWAIEKCTETGITDFVICHTFHSEPGKVKLERLNQIAVAAMKQSGRVYLPEVHSAKNLKVALEMTQDLHRIVAHEKVDEQQRVSDSIDKDLSLWVGPEGGFSEDEISELLKEDAELISLGSYRLRAETAAVVLSAKFL